MADNTRLTEQDNWQLQVNQAGTAVLQTAGKYVDRNISVIVPQGQCTINPEGAVDGSQTKTAQVSTTIDATVANSIASVTESSAEGLSEYFVIKPKTNVDREASTKITIGGTASITAGYVSASEQDLTGESVNVGGIGVDTDDTSALYLPIKELSNSNINGVASFTAEDPDTDDGTVKDNFKVTLTIPAGYYKEQTVTKDFTDILPALNADATSAHILGGERAYDEEGKVILGTMTNYGKGVATMEQTVDGGSTEITGTSVTLRSAEEETAATKKSGIAVTAHGTVGVSSTIEGPGFYEGATSDVSNFSSTAATQYITALTVGSGNALDSVTVNSNASIGEVVNNGTIDALSGVGKVSSLEGQQTIESLKGTIVIDDAVDEDADKTNGNGGTVKFGSETIVTDGALVKASVKENSGKIVVTKGWISADEELDTITQGAYSVECSKVDPTIEYSEEHSEVISISDVITPYEITFSTNLKTAGSHTAKASITTSGYIAESSKETTSESIGVNGVGAEKKVYLAEAEFTTGYSAEKYEDSEVAQKFEVTSSQGYIGNTTVASIDVFDGTFTWS